MSSGRGQVPARPAASAETQGRNPASRLLASPEPIIVPTALPAPAVVGSRAQRCWPRPASHADVGMKSRAQRSRVAAHRDGMEPARLPTTRAQTSHYPDRSSALGREEPASFREPFSDANAGDNNRCDSSGERVNIVPAPVRPVTYRLPRGAGHGRHRMLIAVHSFKISVDFDIPWASPLLRLRLMRAGVALRLAECPASCSTTSRPAST